MKRFKLGAVIGLMAALVAGVGEAKEQRLVFSGYTESTTLTDFQALVKLGEGQNGFSYSDYAANDGTCGGYLFAHMRTGRECGHLYFDVSRDGLTWTQLNGGREIPLSPSYFGHPYITEDDHGEFYLIGAHRFHDQGPPPLVLRQLPQVRRQGDGDSPRRRGSCTARRGSWATSGRTPRSRSRREASRITCARASTSSHPTTGTATWTSPTSTAGGALNAKSDHAVERSVMSRLRRLLPHQA